MSKDMILVERVTDGEKCGINYPNGLGDDCAAFPFHVRENEESGHYRRCPVCLATPAAVVLTEAGYNPEAWKQLAPLPGEVEEAIAIIEIGRLFDLDEGPSAPAFPRYAKASRTLIAHIQAQAVALASLTATIEGVKTALNGPWEPGGDVVQVAKEAGSALQFIGLLRGIGDWNYYHELPGLVNAAIEQRDARIAELEVRESEAIAGAHAEQEASRAWKERAEAAEAALASLESGIGIAQYRRLESANAALAERDARIEELEEAMTHAVHTDTVNDILTRAEAAEAAEASAIGEANEIAESYSILQGAWASDVARLKKAEATLARIVESCRGKCCFCHYFNGAVCINEDRMGYDTPCVEWTPPATWGMEVKL